jgi:tripartite-type tricarboxylate transporter receptor subunit TctC
MIHRRTLLGVPALLAAPALAQGWPDRPIRIVVAFPAGSVTDSLLRNLVEPLSRELGQPVIVDNRPGGSGVVGTMAVKGAAPDGNTLAVLSVTNGALNTYLVRNLGYDPIRDFTPMGFLAEAPYLLVVPNSSPARSVTELMALARARPGALTFSHGNASALIGSQLMNRLAGLQMLPVPAAAARGADRGAGRPHRQHLTDFASGLAQVREGRVRALGVTSPSPFRWPPRSRRSRARCRASADRLVRLSAPGRGAGPVVARFNARWQGCWRARRARAAWAGSATRRARCRPSSGATSSRARSRD